MNLTVIFLILVVMSLALVAICFGFAETSIPNTAANKSSKFTDSTSFYIVLTVTLIMVSTYIISYAFK